MRWESRKSALGRESVGEESHRGPRRRVGAGLGPGERCVARGGRRVPGRDGGRFERLSFEMIGAGRLGSFGLAIVPLA